MHAYAIAEISAEAYAVAGGGTWSKSRASTGRVYGTRTKPAEAGWSREPANCDGVSEHGEM